MKGIVIAIFGFLLLGGIFALSYEQTVIATVLSNFVVDSPINNKMYTYKEVYINASLNTLASSITYSDNGEGFKILCKNCQNVSKKRAFDEGKHRLVVSAVSGDKVYTNIINFTVDSKKPKIVRTSPKKGYANGEFNLQYIEENVKKIVLHYGNDLVELNVSKDCWEDDERRYCSKNISLGSYDGQEIDYWFTIEDIAGNSVDSKKIKVKVDVSPPVIKNPNSFFSYQNGNRNVYFKINIEEPNFDKTTYVYIDPKGNLEKGNICTSLKNGFCEKRIVFKKGKYNMTLNVMDEAGNSVLLPTNFEVVY